MFKSIVPLRHPVNPRSKVFTCKRVQRVESSASSASQMSGTTEWYSKTIELPPYSRGCHLITRKVMESAPEISEFEVGLCNFFIQHTSASLTINENASPDVLLDLADAMDRLAPEGNKVQYRHDDEGPDDMPAHVKSSLMGASLLVPIQSGRLALGTWQGIYLNEHRCAEAFADLMGSDLMYSVFNMQELWWSSSDSYHHPRPKES